MDHAKDNMALTVNVNVNLTMLLNLLQLLNQKVKIYLIIKTAYINIWCNGR